MRDALASGALEQQTEADYDFHGAIIRSMGNEVFSSVYRTLGAFMREEIHKTNLDGVARAAAVQEHEALLQAILSGKISLALAAYREHLRSTRQQLARSLQPSGAEALRRAGPVGRPAPSIAGTSRGDRTSRATGCFLQDRIPQHAREAPREGCLLERPAKKVPRSRPGILGVLQAHNRHVVGRRSVPTAPAASYRQAGLRREDGVPVRGAERHHPEGCSRRTASTDAPGRASLRSGACRFRITACAA